jgi:hypothetical protein
MRVFGIAILFVLVSFTELNACRFTVREIGFSILSQDIYTIVVIDESAKPNDKLWKEFHAKNRDCNLRLEVLSPIFDLEHPIVKGAKKQGLEIPATVLVAPDGRIFPFEGNDIKEIYNKILDSPLNVKLRNVLPDIFAAVIWVEGKNLEQNSLVRKKIKQECDAIENIMPGMPKVVKEGPLEIGITTNDFQNEQLLLWSLGINKIPESPIAFVIYGRGRIIGDTLSYTQIEEGSLYKYMSMIGADCECGLDKKWMLGNQVPLLWDKISRQHLAKLVGFDVDNPMILAEMSRILAKESLSDETGSVAFAPEVIDLDKVFEITSNPPKVHEKQIIENKSSKALIYTLVALFVMIISVTSFLLFRKRK